MDIESKMDKNNLNYLNNLIKIKGNDEKNVL
jgi:hypothetical protein